MYSSATFTSSDSLPWGFYCVENIVPPNLTFLLHSHPPSRKASGCDGPERQIRSRQSGSAFRCSLTARARRQPATRWRPVYGVHSGNRVATAHLPAILSTTIYLNVSLGAVLRHAVAICSRQQPLPVSVLFTYAHIGSRYHLLCACGISLRLY